MLVLSSVEEDVSIYNSSSCYQLPPDTKIQSEGLVFAQFSSVQSKFQLRGRNSRRSVCYWLGSFTNEIITKPLFQMSKYRSIFFMNLYFTLCWMQIAFINIIFKQFHLWLSGVPIISHINIIMMNNHFLSLCVLYTPVVLRMLKCLY